MNLYVLSELHPENKHVGWTVSYSLEDVLAEACEATFLYPAKNSQVRVLRRYRQRIFKSWYRLSEMPLLGAGPNVLLVVGLDVGFLTSIFALGPLLSQFDLRIGYVLDGFDPAHLDRDVLPLLDHLCVISSELTDEIGTRAKSSFLPLATNVMRFGSQQRQRGIDIINYGRTNPQLHKTLQVHYNQQSNDRVYFHTTFSRPEVNDPREHLILLSKLLSQSKISLCFEPSYIPRFRGRSPILYRWFEGWASGCTIVGKKPFGRDVAPLLDWENSTFELPDAEADWIPFFEELLNNRSLLESNTRQNYQQALLRHDWRHRIRDLFERLELPLPETLQGQLRQLEQKAATVAVPLQA